jgi:hypothetical protein
MNSIGVPEREPHVPAQAPLDLLDRMERLPRVRALVSPAPPVKRSLIAYDH